TYRKALASVIQIDVALIGNYPDAALVGQADDFGHVFRAHYGSGGVGGRIEDDELGLRRHQLGDHVGGDAKALRFVALEEHAITAGVAHHVFERDPVGDGKDDLIAVIDKHGNDVEERVFAAYGGSGFFTAVIGVEVDGMTVDDGVLQFGGAADGSVLREIRLDGGDGGILYVLRRGKVGFAGAEIHDINTLLAQLVSFGHHRHGRGGLNTIDAFGQADGVGDGCDYGAHEFPAVLLQLLFSGLALGFGRHLIAGLLAVLEFVSYIYFLTKFLFDEFGHQAIDRSAQFRDFTHQTRTEVRIFFSGHHEHRLQTGLEFAIHECHLEFVLVVADGANAPQDDPGFKLQRVV